MDGFRLSWSLAVVALLCPFAAAQELTPGVTWEDVARLTPAERAAAAASLGNATPIFESAAALPAAAETPSEPPRPPRALARMLCATGETAACAEAVGEPGAIPQRLEGALVLRHEGFDRIVLEGELDVLSLTLDGAPTPPSEIREALSFLQSARPDDLPPLLAALDARMNATLRDALALTPDAEVVALDVLLDRSDLFDATAADRPLRANVSGLLAPRAPHLRDPAFAIQALAALGAGGTAPIDMTLHAPAGADLEYRLVPPDGLRFTDTSVGELSEGALTLRIENGDSNASAFRTIATTLDDPATEPPGEDRAHSRVEVSFSRLTGEGWPVHVEAQLDLLAIPVSAANVSLPHGLRLERVDAEGLRALLASGALSLETLDELASRSERELRARLGDVIGQGAELLAHVDPATLAADATGPVRVLLSGDGMRRLDAGDAKLLDVALDLGAIVDVPLSLPDAPAGGAEILIRLPNGTRTEHGSRIAEFELGDEPIERSFPLWRVAAERPQEQDVRVAVHVDAGRIEYTTSGVLEGQQPQLVATILATVRIDAVALPPEALARLDARVDLKHVTSDGIRRLLAEGLITLADLSAIEARLLAEAGSVAPGGAVAGGFDRASFSHDSAPLLFTARATVRQPLAAGAPAATASVALHTLSQTLKLERVADAPTTYTLLFPAGLDVRVVGVEGGSASVGRSGDRALLTAAPETDPMEVKMDVVVTPAFLWAHFAPLVVLLVGAILVLLEVPLGALWARRRLRARGRT